MQHSGFLFCFLLYLPNLPSGPWLQKWGRGLGKEGEVAGAQGVQGGGGRGGHSPAKNSLPPHEIFFKKNHSPELFYTGLLQLLIAMGWGNKHTQTPHVTLNKVWKH